MRLDLGDAFLDLNLRVKGQHRRRFHIRVGIPRDSTPSDRVVSGPPYACNIDKKGVILMDLQADKKVPLSASWTDEVENPVPAPEGATVAFTVDDPTIISLVTDDDGVTWAAATGTLGNAFVHMKASVDGGTPLTGDLGITVIAGDAERVEIVAGDPVEVTPDV